MTANGRPDAPWAVISVPKGWGTIGGWSISNENPGGDSVVGYWTIDNVYQDPASRPTRPTRIPAGSTVESLAAAFTQQRLSRMTAPVPSPSVATRGSPSSPRPDGPGRHELRPVTASGSGRPPGSGTWRSRRLRHAPHP